jgi:hypothetical protein
MWKTTRRGLVAAALLSGFCYRAAGQEEPAAKPQERILGIWHSDEVDEKAGRPSCAYTFGEESRFVRRTVRNGTVVTERGKYFINGKTLLLRFSADGKNVQHATRAFRFAENCLEIKEPDGWVTLVEVGHEWWNYPDFDKWSDSRRELPPEQFWEPVYSKACLAVDVLKERDCVELSVEQARDYVGVHYKPGEGQKPYLVRGLLDCYGLGEFSILQRGDDLWVFHLAPGAGGVPIPCPLVVSLKKPPRAIYVTTGSYL